MFVSFWFSFRKSLHTNSKLSIHKQLGIKLRKADVTDKKLVSEILVSAFLTLEETNSINFVVKQDKKRNKRMQILMEYLFEKAIHYGEVHISENNKACILLKFQNKEKITLKSIILDINLAIKCIGIERILNVLKRQRIANKYYPKEKHIRPMIMGVKKEYKGNGTAARLMLEVKNKFKNNKLPIILDTTSKENAKLYEKFGFKIIKKEEALGFPIYFLRLN